MLSLVAGAALTRNETNRMTEVSGGLNRYRPQKVDLFSLWIRCAKPRLATEKRVSLGVTGLVPFAREDKRGTRE